MKKLILPFLFILITIIKGFSQSPSPAVDSKEYEDIKQQGILQRGSALPNAQSFTPSLEDFKRLGITHQMRNNGGVSSTASTSGCSCYIPPDNTYTLALPPSDDGSTSSLNIPFVFCLYGTNYTSLYINNNGNVSFGASYSSFSGQGFPSQNNIMLAPFWADVDTRGTGSVKYKITSTAIYINWTSVGYYNQHTDKVNSFQLIITNGSDPILPPSNNIAFCYGNMQWTTGDASNGTNGFGGAPAIVGLNKGDGISYVQFGLFDQQGIIYDGGYGANDGVDWLGNKSFYFNSCPNTNLPPIATGFNICDTIKICGSGDSLILKGSFFAAEIGQNTTISVNFNGTANASVISNIPGNTAEAQVKIIASAANAGNNIITFTATDNGSPAGITVVNINVLITLINPLTVTANATATSVCAGTPVTLTGGGAASYTWTGGITNGVAFIPTATAVYSLTGTAGGCSSTVTKTITVNPLPVSNAGNDLTICAGVSRSMGAAPVTGNTYSWRPGAGLSDSTISNPNNTIINNTGSPIVTTYTLTTITTSTGCQSKDTSIVTIINQSPPSLVITNPAAVCYPNTIDITASSITAGSTVGGTLSYWTNAGTSSILYLPNAVATSGTNYIKLTAAGGCTDIKPIIVTINPAPISNAGSDLTICSGIAGSIGASSIAGNTYSWNPSSGLSDAAISNPANTTVNTTNAPIVTTYTVTTIITATGCQSTDNAVITINPQPILTITNPAAVCSPNTINLKATSITAGSTGGGTLSYWTDAGSSDSLSSPNAVTASGTNYIEVTTTGGCTDIKPVIVTIHPQPVATFSTQNESSSLYCDGSIKAILTGGTGTIQDQWLNASQTILSTTDSVGGLCPGTYTLNLIDANSCTNTYTETIQAGPLPPTPPICMVTVDNTNTHNLVIWEKSNLNSTAIDSIEIYREIGTNSYARIGAVSSDSLSVFDDHGANPASTGYRYKLKSKNYHSAVSSLSDYHNTIYLTNTGANFSWTQYQVENNTTPVFSYHIYRDDNSTGNFVDIGNTTGNQFGYTDVNFASYPNSQYYVEAVMTAGSCTPTRASFGGSRSNLKHFGISAVQELNTDAGFSIYPNPFSTQTTITFNEEQKNTTIKIIDVMGRQIKSIDFKGRTLILEKEEMKPGIYFIQISDESFDKLRMTNVVNRKIVVE